MSNNLETNATRDAVSDEEALDCVEIRFIGPLVIGCEWEIDSEKLLTLAAEHIARHTENVTLDETVDGSGEVIAQSTRFSLWGENEWCIVVRLLFDDDDEGIDHELGFELEMCDPPIKSNMQAIVHWDFCQSDEPHSHSCRSPPFLFNFVKGQWLVYMARFKLDLKIGFKSVTCVMKRIDDILARWRAESSHANRSQAGGGSELSEASNSRRRSKSLPRMQTTDRENCGKSHQSTQTDSTPSSTTITGRVFHAHKLVIFTRAESLYRHFNLEPDQRKVEMTGISDKVLENILEYVYTGNASIVKTCNDLLLELFDVAQKFALSGLSDMCASSLVDQMSSENVEELLILSEKHRHEKLKRAAVNHITRNLSRTLESTGLKKLKQHPDLLLHIMSSISSHGCPVVAANESDD